MSEPTGAVYTLLWDDARRLTSVRSNAGERMAFSYDAMGNRRVTTAADASGALTFRETGVFDELGRLLRQVGGEGRAWRFAYDRTGELTAATDPRQKSLSFGYDAVGRLVRETERDGGVVRHGYDGRDAQTSYTDPRSLATTYLRNGFGEVIQELSPDRGVTVTDHDPRGLPVSRTDARGVTATMAYDGAGRLLSRAYPAANLQVDLTYDATAGGSKGKGRLTRMADRTGVATYTWDGKGRVTAESRTITGVPHQIGYAYDGPGRLRSIVYPSGRIVTYSYDALGRVSGVGLKRSASAPEEPVVSGGTYRPFGPLQALSFGNGMSLATGWDLEGRISALDLTTPNGTGRMSLSYAVGDGLNLTGIADALDPVQSQTFGYDDAGRLSSAMGPYGALSWTYDAVGNRRSETRAGVAKSYAYPAAPNRLESVTEGAAVTRSFAHDAAGNLTADTAGATTTTSTISDAGRLAQVRVGGAVRANYYYDGRERLAIRQQPGGPTTHLIHDTRDRLIAETDGAGVTLREYLWLDDLPVAVLDGSADPANPVLLFVHADHLKRPALMTDAARAIVWRARYEPFGAVRSITGTASLDLRFPGQWFQLESGLHYNWHRHYDPTTGRYTQTNPLGLDHRVNRAIVDASTSTSPSSLIVPRSATEARRSLPMFTTSLTQLQQDKVGLAAILATVGDGRRAIRDGASQFAYARQSPIMRTDAAGLISGPMTPLPMSPLLTQCMGPFEWMRCHVECWAESESGPQGSERFQRYRRCIRACLGNLSDW